MMLKPPILNYCSITYQYHFLNVADSYIQLVLQDGAAMFERVELLKQEGMKRAESNQAELIL